MVVLNHQIPSILPILILARLTIIVIIIITIIIVIVVIVAIIRDWSRQCDRRALCVRPDTMLPQPPDDDGPYALLRKLSSDTRGRGWHTRYANVHDTLCDRRS